jgi:hypothetical protein
MLKFIVFVSLLITGTALAEPKPLVSFESGRGTLGIDMDFLLLPSQMNLIDSKTPGIQNLSEIIDLGARLLTWVDILQKDTPIQDREQIWRRVDRIGNEPTYEKPLYYNEHIILDTYSTTLANTPKAIVDILKGSAALPTNPPEGFDIKTLMNYLRPLHVIYSDASRWLALYRWRYSLNKAQLDFRGALKLIAARSQLTDITEKWSQLSLSEREAFINRVSEACPITNEGSEAACRSDAEANLSASEKGQLAAQWLSKMLVASQKVIDAQFGVRTTHSGVTKKTSANFHEILIPTLWIEPDTLSWIQERVNESWFFKDIVGVTLYNVPSYVRGAVRVKWQKGVLPNVNGVAGDIITMDSNTPKWLEEAQAVMRHEMGHVLGFTDCYTEFWDETLSAFTYYSLDPSDAMCALSGQYLTRHKDALLEGYFK